MNFVDSIGSVMKGPGLEEALETVYGPNAVTHTRSDDVRQSYFKSTSFMWPFFGER